MTPVTAYYIQNSDITEFNHIIFIYPSLKRIPLIPIKILDGEKNTNREGENEEQQRPLLLNQQKIITQGKNEEKVRQIGGFRGINKGRKGVKEKRPVGRMRKNACKNISTKV